MQAIARETNLSETTFVLPDDAETELAQGVRVRIFTAQEELPFAGHPTLGTASWLWLHHPVLRGRGDHHAAAERWAHHGALCPAAGEQPGVFATMQQLDPVFGDTHDRATVAAMLGLQADDLSAEHPPQTVSTGAPICIVLLRDLQAAQRLQTSPRELHAWLDAIQAKFCYCIAPVNAHDATAPQWHARMQFYGGEDPATGAAAGCCIAWLVNVGLAAPDTATLIEQGIEMHRPSRITAQASRSEVGSAFRSGFGPHHSRGSRKFFLALTETLSHSREPQTPTGTGRSRLRWIRQQIVIGFHTENSRLPRRGRVRMLGKSSTTAYAVPTQV
jgi:trans-2,3-dihydro-3-hydroxyanthranilate isomerase